MVAYSFKAQFAEPILAGTKGGTIRADRRRHARPGEELQLYTGMRTQHCRLIARKTCVAVEPVTLVLFADIVMEMAIFPERKTALADRDELNAFARFDGFASIDEMRAFWRTEHPNIEPLRGFKGWHIRWAPFPTDNITAKESP